MKSALGVTLTRSISQSMKSINETVFKIHTPTILFHLEQLRCCVLVCARIHVQFIYKCRRFPGLCVCVCVCVCVCIMIITIMSLFSQDCILSKNLFSEISSLKPLGQLKPNFMWNRHGIGEESLFKWSRSFVVLHYCQPPRGGGF